MFLFFRDCHEQPKVEKQVPPSHWHPFTAPFGSDINCGCCSLAVLFRYAHSAPQETALWLLAPEERGMCCLLRTSGAGPSLLLGWRPVCLSSSLLCYLSSRQVTTRRPVVSSPQKFVPIGLVDPPDVSFSKGRRGKETQPVCDACSVQGGRLGVWKCYMPSPIAGYNPQPLEESALKCRGKVLETFVTKVSV